MKRKGFTLIELLAIIVVLTIIALIAVPTILNIINNAQKSAFKDSVYGIIKSGEMYYSNQMMETDGMTEDKTFTFPEANGLEIKGSKPTSGTMIVTIDGKIGLAVSNGKYCIKKGYVNEELIVDETLNNCEIPSILTSQNTCVKDKSVTCANGTAVTVQVNKDTSYNFYVIKDTGSELTLIMDRNLEDEVAWINQEDYLSSGGTTEDYGDWGRNNKGPITALNYLERETSNWTNIPPMNYTLVDDKQSPLYQPIVRKNVRSRILTSTETINLGCTENSCPDYLYSNLNDVDNDDIHNSYWLSTTIESDDCASIIYYGGGTTWSDFVSSDLAGVRPVITLSKNL